MHTSDSVNHISEIGKLEASVV